jgi:hypothetical protein
LNNNYKNNFVYNINLFYLKKKSVICIPLLIIIKDIITKILYNNY